MPQFIVSFNLNYFKKGCAAFLMVLIVTSCETDKQHIKAITSGNMLIRIAEIEIDSNAIDNYMAILKEESEASVRLETGVISIYPMYQKKTPTKIIILEIYANEAAYKSHLQTPHFKKYKTSTTHMVKSLKLIEMDALDVSSMPLIFKKLGN